MTVSVYPACETSIQPETVQHFYKSFWPRKTALLVDRFYRWQFIHSPAAKNLDHCCLALDNKTRELVGVMGITPRPFNLAGETLPGAELTTWIVHPQHQHKGVGVCILNYLQSRYAVLIGMGITSMALPLYCRMGFRYLKGIPRYIKVCNWDAVKKFSEVQPLAIKIDRFWEKTATHEKYRAILISENAIEYLQNINGKSFNFFHRDAAHINWRYINHPFFHYQNFFISKENGAPNELVHLCFREETSVSGARILHVMECIGDTSCIPSAICFLEDYGRKHHFDAVDFYCTSSVIASYFIARGWFSTLDDESLKMPHLFHPIELRNPATTSLIYWTKYNMHQLCDFSKLYITKQDADLDRPTFDFLNTRNCTSISAHLDPAHYL